MRVKARVPRLLARLTRFSQEIRFAHMRVVLDFLVFFLFNQACPYKSTGFIQIKFGNSGLYPNKALHSGPYLDKAREFINCYICQKQRKPRQSYDNSSYQCER